MGSCDLGAKSKVVPRKSKYSFSSGFLEFGQSRKLSSKVESVIFACKTYDLVNSGVRTGMGDEVFRIGAVKYTADGSASERTMRMSEPYEGRPDDFGLLYMTEQEIHEEVERAHRNDFQVAVHANGDVTIAMVLDAFERAQQLWPREDTRHRIEHCSLVNPDLLGRIRDLGVVPAPFYTYVHYHGNKWVEYGEVRMRCMFALRSFLDYYFRVAPASD